SAYSHCNQWGQWTDQVPACELPRCPALASPQNGQLSTSGRLAAGESVRVVCDPGYALTGPDELTCQLNQTYDKPLSSCKDMDECASKNPCGPWKCLNLPGSYACACPDGYTHDDSSLQICVDIDECQVSDPCSHVCKNLNGSFTCGCPPGMSLYHGPSYVTRTGVVLVDRRSCIQTCPEVKLTGVGTVFYDQDALTDGSLLATTISRTLCPPGFHNESSVPALCLDSGRWSHQVNCLESRCEPPEITVPNLRVDYSRLTVHSQTTLTCDQGFTLSGNSKLLCLPRPESGSRGQTEFAWAGSLPNCTRVKCPQPAAPTLGQVTVTSTYFSDQALFRCPCGHRLVGQSLVTCTETGTWSAPTPSCEPLACPHPGMPQCGNISHVTGFPVGSRADFRCSGRGFELNGPASVTCQALHHTQVSELLPRADIKLSLGLNFKGQEVHRVCLGKYQKKLKKGLEVWFSHITECLNSSAQIVSETRPGLLDKQATLELVLTVRFLSGDSLCPCSEALDQRLKRLEINALVNRQSTGPQSCLNLVSVVSSKPQKEAGWLCPLGLRLDAAGFPCQSDKRPVCMDDCFMKLPPTLNATDSAHTVRSIFVNTPTSNSATQMGLTVRKRLEPPYSNNTGSPWDPQSSYFGWRQSYDEKGPTTNAPKNTLPYYDDKRSATFPPCNPFLKYASPQLSTHAPCNPTQSFTEPRTLRDEEWRGVTLRYPTQWTTNPPRVPSPDWTDKQPTTNAPGEEFSARQAPTNSSWNFSEMDYTPLPRDLPETEHKDKPMTEQGGDMFLQRKSSDSLWRESSNGQTQRVQNFPSGAASSPGVRVSNCTGKPRTGGSGDWQNLDGKDNSSDCLTTHPLEKDEVTMIQLPPVPKPNMSSPMFTVDVKDEMSGSFSNISCIDAVHMSINAKVNQLLREFAAQMGRAVCEEIPESTLQLAAGSIRFKGTLAHISVTFTISYKQSARSSVESCGEEFKAYASAQLPKKFGKTKMETPPRDCSFVQYTGREFVFTSSGWTCHRGYALDVSM
ncbi:hypothetical protein EGW08_019065, partial [Elysia chlorotica]